MRTDRPVESTGTGPQELLRGDDHPRRTAVLLQLTDDEMSVLQAQARADHRSVEDVAADAVREYTARSAHRVRVQAATERVVDRYAEALRELAGR
jgi:hypothetical protein